MVENEAQFTDQYAEDKSFNNIIYYYIVLLTTSLQVHLPTIVH